MDSDKAIKYFELGYDSRSIRTNTGTIYIRMTQLMSETGRSPLYIQKQQKCLRESYIVTTICTPLTRLTAVAQIVQIPTEILNLKMILIKKLFPKLSKAYILNDNRNHFSTIT